MPKEGAVTLYLESWQKRMVKDFVAKAGKVNKVRIKWRPGGCLASYKIPVDGIHKGDWVIYLTDQQITQVSDELGLPTPVANVNITADAIKNGEITFG